MRRNSFMKYELTRKQIQKNYCILKIKVLQSVKIEYLWMKFAEEANAAEGVTLSGFPQGKGTANGHNFGEAH